MTTVLIAILIIGAVFWAAGITWEDVKNYFLRR